MSLVKILIERSQVNGVRMRPARIEGMPDEYLQKIWLFKPLSRFPIEVEIRIPPPLHFYEAGDYLCDISQNIQTNKYGSLELAPYGTTALIAVTPDFIVNFDKTVSGLFDSLSNQTEQKTTKPVSFMGQK